jgi:hypothetical protein
MDNNKGKNNSYNIFQEITILGIKLALLYWAIIAFVIIFLIILIANSFKGKSPMLFPLNDTKASYTITKDTDGLYELVYDGPAQSLADHAYIITTPIDVAPYENKNITVKGEFISGTQQCIVDKCTPLSTNWHGVKINQIDEK